MVKRTNNSESQNNFGRYSITSLYNNTAELPDHTLASNTDEENVKIERKWHGQWCSFSIETEEDFFMGSMNNQRLKDETSRWKKFSGLPT